MLNTDAKSELLGFLDASEDMIGHRQAAGGVIANAGFLVAPTVNALVERLAAALGGARPPTLPADHAQQYDWDAIAEQALSAYQRAIDGAW